MTLKVDIERVAVALAGRGYEIVIGQGLLDRAGAEITAVVGTRRLVVVTDATVGGLHMDRLAASLDSAGLRFDIVTVPAGEASKDVHRFPELLERILGLGIDRKTVIVAFGGGVVGDLAGFAAASLLRGLDFVQIPTTLLAQIDSSVGGKTGVNSRQGKNLIGAFHQPRLVLADLDMLATLPRRELVAGYAEMAKYGLLGDSAFFEHLEATAPRLLALDPELLGPAVAHCCRMKAEIVAEDEREAGRRALLNLGHTFGHALEAETGFSGMLLHGEGVGIGMALAADLSVRLGRLSPDGPDRIRHHLDMTGIPSRLAQIRSAPFDGQRLLAHMGHDKKAEDGRLTFIVLDGIGRAAVEKNVDPRIVAQILAVAGAI